MTDEEIKAIRDENAALKKQLVVETIRRLYSEMQAAKSSIAAIQMRIPMIENELDVAQRQLGEMTKDA